MREGAGKEKGVGVIERKEHMILCWGCAPRWLKGMLPKPLEWTGPEKCIGCGLNPSIIMGKFRSRVWVLGIKAEQYQGGAVTYASFLGDEL